jgi:hypothetical protein
MKAIQSIISLSLVAALFVAPLTTYANDTAAADKTSSSRIEDKLVELGELKGELKALEVQIDATQAEFDTAKKKRVGKTVLWGFSAVTLTALTLVLAKMAIASTSSGGGWWDFSGLFRFMFGAGAVLSGGGAAMSGHIVWLTHQQVAQLRVKLEEAEAKIAEAKVKIETKKEELELLRELQAEKAKNQD